MNKTNENLGKVRVSMCISNFIMVNTTLERFIYIEDMD